jgi:hypothetical protein
MKKVLILSLLFWGFLKITATITQIRWGSTTGPLDGLTIDWTSTGTSDQIRWGYTVNYEMGTFTTTQRPGISPGSSFFRYAFPIVTPNATLYYQLYDSSNNSWISQKTFKTAPPSNTTNFNFIVQGDSRNNVNTVWKNIADKVNAKNRAFTLFTGDITKSGNKVNEYNTWFDNAVDYLADNIIYHAQGNHEVPGSVDYYQTMFPLPKNNPDNTNLYYSFKYGNALFISLNSEDVQSATSPQSLWLKSTLENAKNDPSITWRIIFYHRPLVNAGKHYGEEIPRRSSWGAWFDEYDVDLILNGHDHNYQRTKPINFDSSGNVSTTTEYGTSPGKGMCEMICGGLGANLTSQTTNADVPLTSIFYEGFNYVYVTIDNAVLTAKVYTLGSQPSSTAPENLLETVIINKNSTMATHEIRANKQNPINIYPNPVTDKLNLTYDSQEMGAATIRIYDMSAREIQSFKVNKNSKNFKTTVDVSTYAKGLYNISFIMGEHKDSTIFIKQ